MSQEETRFRRFPLACCQISELNCSKVPLNRRSSATILSNICLIAAPILAPNLPISGNTAEYPATGSSIKNPVFMRVCGHFEARPTTRYDTNVITPKPEAPGSSPGRRTKNAVISTLRADNEALKELNHQSQQWQRKSPRLVHYELFSVISFLSAYSISDCSPAVMAAEKNQRRCG